MKKQFLSVAVIAGLAITVVSCGNDNNDSATTDTTATTNTTTSSGMDTATTTTTTTSTGNYAAMADSVERNSQQGYYLNPRTGRHIKTCV
jgi:ABC-type glycerol-3-phosphate transport system substrate-binding protein